MASKPLSLEDLCKMTRAQLEETASDYGVVLTGTTKAEILSELLTKLPTFDRPTSVSHLGLEGGPEAAGTQKVAETKIKVVKSSASSGGSSRSSLDVFKEPITEISLEYEKIQLERERMAFQRHQAELEMSRLREQSELEMARLSEQYRHELELKSLELQHQSGTVSAGTPAQRVDFRIVDAARMVPKFDSSDLENYLLSFERICAVNSWPKQHWSAILQTQLTGKALKVFAELSEQDCSNYDVLKKALIVAYELCPEVYRKRFRSFSKLSHDTYAYFAFKLHNVFKRWLEGVKAYDDLDTLRQTMLLEQFFHVLPDELKLWLTDQKPKSLSEAAQLADQYVALHKSVSVKQAVSGVQPESATDSKVYTVFNKQSDRNGTKAFSKRRSFRNVTCFKCHRRGHIMSQCRVKLKPTFTVGQEQPDTTQTTSASNSVQSVTFPAPQVNTMHPLFELFCECGYIVHNDTGDRTKITILRDTAALQ